MTTHRKLEASFGKINRARALMADFTETVDNYSRNLSGRIVREPDETGLVHIKLKTFEPVPIAANHLAAEIIYHLRSSLDQAVAEIGRQNGLNDTKHLYFPFAGSREQYSRKGVRNKVRGLPDDVKKTLEEFEPFPDGNRELWALSALANVDKHNMLIPIGGIGQFSDVSNLHVNGGGHPGSTGLIISGPSDLLEGVTISKIGPSGSFSADKLHFEYYVGFGNVPVFSHCLSTQVMSNLIELGERVVQTLSTNCFGE